MSVQKAILAAPPKEDDAYTAAYRILIKPAVGQHYDCLVADDLIGSLDHETHLQAHAEFSSRLIAGKGKEKMQKFREFARFDKNPFRRFVEKLIVRFLDRHLESWLGQRGGYTPYDWTKHVDEKVDALYSALGYETAHESGKPPMLVAKKKAKAKKK